VRNYNILIVDDNTENIRVIANILKDNESYNFMYATNGEEALTRTRESDIDLILLDVMMSPLDGYSVCRILKKDSYTRDIPIIFITAKADSESMLEGFLSGGIDYISKPFNPYELEARVDNQIRIRSSQESRVVNVQQKVINIIAQLGKEKSIDIKGKNIERVTQYAILLASLAKLSTFEIKELRLATPLHAIGKILIDKSILHKTTKLTDEEISIIREYPQIGYDVLSGSDEELLRAGAIIAHQHNENFDGSGYPQGLKGDKIHIYGRIVAVAHVFDALTRERGYGKVWDIEEARDYMEEQSGKKFDPKLINIFLDNFDRFAKIYNEYITI
jgi:putative two-component system response regulator